MLRDHEPCRALGYTVVRLVWLLLEGKATEWGSHASSGEPPWDLLSEKICAVVNGERIVP